jgi:hypothetical protein
MNTLEPLSSILTREDTRRHAKEAIAFGSLRVPSCPFVSLRGRPISGFSTDALGLCQHL